MARKKRHTRRKTVKIPEEEVDVKNLGDLKEETTVACSVRELEGAENEEEANANEDDTKEQTTEKEETVDMEEEDEEEEDEEEKEEKETSNGAGTTRKSLDGRDSEIRFGALEIMAAYTGGEEEGSVPYSFVILTNDITYGDEDTDVVKVQWLEPSLKGNLYIEDESDIAIGSFICPVTTEIIDLGNGTYEVTKAVHTMVKNKLERQLADDYDPEEDYKDEMDYEARMSKKRKSKVGTEEVTKKRGRKKKRSGDDLDFDLKETTTATKRGRKKKKLDHDADHDEDVKMEDIDFKEEDDDEDDGGTKSDTKKKQKRKTTKTATTTTKNSKKKKSQLEPRSDLEIVENSWFNGGKADSFNGDTHRASKEIIRSYLSKDKVLFQKLLKDSKNIADIFVHQSCVLQKNVYDYAVLNEDKETMATLLKEMKANTPRAPFPLCSLFEFSSGSHTSRHAAYNRYNVGASRGGKEGNNAFTDDMEGNSYSKGQPEARIDIVELLRTHDSVSVDFFNHFDKEACDGNLISWGFNFHNLVVFGHQELAQHAMKILLHRDAGLNNLHVDCLGSGHTLDKFRTVSVEKKSSSDAGVRFCPVHCAASNSNPTYLQQLLEVKPDAVDCVDSEEGGLLHYAAVGKTPDTLKWLLDGPGASLNRNLKLRKGDKTTPLMWAARTCRADNIRLLCDEGKHEKTPEMLKTLDVEGLSALHHVAQSNRTGRLEAAKALIDCGADPNIKGDVRLMNKQTPFMLCAAKGDLDLLKVLHDAGGDPLLTDKLGKTPLMLSVKNGNIHVASYLLKIGVNVDAEDSSGNTALHYACAYGWSDCLKLLIQVGSDINASNSWMTTPLELALKKGRFACAVILLKHNADVNVIDKNGVSLFNSLVVSYVEQLSQKSDLPLPWAIKKIMERDDLDITTTDKSGQTLLHYIARVTTKSDLLLNLVKTFLEKGADPLIVDKDGQPPVIIALKQKNLGLCCHLLEHASHAGILKDYKENLVNILMQNIVGIDNEIFIKLFNQFNQLNPSWMTNIDDNGMTPVMIAAQVIRSNWVATKGKGKETLEFLFDNYPDQVEGEIARKVKFREWNEDLIENGVPNWNTNEEYQDGSRTILHEILQCPDIDWVLQMCQKYSKHFKKSHFTLKANNGYDSIAYALDTFVQKDVSVESVLKLIGFLKENGAQVNNVWHPLFNSLHEAESTEFTLQFDVSNRNLDEASLYVRQKEQLRVKNLLADEKKRQSVDAIDFEPHLSVLLKREGDERPKPELLQKLMKDYEFDPEIRDLYGNTLLHTVTEMNYFQCCLPFSDVNAVNMKGESPLSLAAGDITRMRLLIESGADVNHLSPKGTALHIAVSKGSSEEVELLLKTANVNIKDHNGLSALHLAVSYGATSTKETLNPIENQLLLAGADVNATDNHGRSPIHYCFFPVHKDTKCNFPPASKRDPIDMLTALASRADIDFGIKDNDQRTPLHYAAAVGASICVLLLCEKLESVLNNRDMDDNTPLGLSILAGRADTSILLVSKGADIDVSVTKTTRFRKDDKIITKSKEKGSALKMALQIESCESVARYILAAEKLPILTVLNALFSTGKFQLAMNRIKMCQSTQSLRSTHKDDGMTALHYLACAKSFANAKGFADALLHTLIGRNVPLSSKCHKGRTALHLASMYGHFELCQLFIRECNLKVDEKDSNGDNTLSLMFNCGTPSHKLLFLLADASENKPTFINTCIKGRGDKGDDQRWKELSSLEHTLLWTPENKRHAKEEFIRLLKVKDIPPKPAVKDSTIYEIKSTPLIEAVKAKDGSMVNTILFFGADGSKKDENGRTALHHAIMSNDTEMVSLILKWNRVPLDCIDNFGFSALSYSILQSLKSPTSRDNFYKLLTFGADPSLGCALSIALKANLEEMVLAMLHCRKNQCMKVNDSEIASSLKIGELVWTRYSALSSVWSLAKVSDVTGSTYSVIPCTQVGQTNSANQRLTPWMKSSREICGVDTSCVCLYDKNSDLAKEANVAILSCMDKGLSENEKKAKLKRYAGAEVNLLKEINTHDTTMVSLMAELKEGDLVGYLQPPSSNLFVGEITNVHKNQKLDVKLLNGQTLNMLNRTHLRPLSDDLKLKPNRVHRELNSNFIHELLQPIESIFFDNVQILKALIDAGLDVKKKNAKGKIPLDIVPVGCAIREYLCTLSKTEQMEQVLPSKDSLPNNATDIELEADADAEYQSLLAVESSNTERVIPKIIPVCKSELDQDSADNHVLEEDGDFFDVSLTKVDVKQGQYGKYDFYKMQIAYLPMKNTYVLLTNWGRIEEIRAGGKYQQTPFTDKEACKKEFRKVFKSKTGNLWEQRNNFVKQPKKYRLVNRPKLRLKNPEKLLGEALTENLPCSISQPVAELLRFFLDVKRLTAAYASHMNDESLPFGKLTLTTIQSAERKLEEIKQSLKELNEVQGKGNMDVNDFRKAIDNIAVMTNEFYELLPLGGEGIVTPFQQNDSRFQQAASLIYHLRDLTVTKQLLMGSRYRQNTTNPIDYAYNALGIEIKPLDMNCTERKVLMKYVDNTCTEEDVIIQQIYSLNDGKDPSDVPNKKLLFHGSANKNVLGILKHGLLVAPPGANRHGAAYGDGVYFSDQFSKAFGYSSGLRSYDHSQPRCFIFIAEVALGQSHLTNSDYNIKYPAGGTNSTHAQGGREPDTTYDIVLSSTGEKVPLGKLITTPKKQKQFHWSKTPNNSRYHWSQPLPSDASVKIEKLRTDPTTEFPFKVKVQFNDKEQEVTVYGPDSDIAFMGNVGVNEKAQSSTKHNGKDKDEDMEEGEEDEQDSDEEMEEDDEEDLHMSSFGNTSHLMNGDATSNVTTIYRVEQNNYGYDSSSPSEFIVYDTKQIRLKYLLEVTSKSWVKDQHIEDASAIKD